MSLTIEAARAEFAPKYRAGIHEFLSLAHAIAERIAEKDAAFDFEHAARAITYARQWEGTFSGGTSRVMYAAVRKYAERMPLLKSECIPSEIAVMLAAANLCKGATHGHGLAELLLPLPPLARSAAWEYARRFAAEGRAIFYAGAIHEAKSEEARFVASLSEEVAQVAKSAERKAERESRKAEKDAGRTRQLPVDALPLFSPAAAA